MRFLLVDKAKDEIFVEHLNVFVFSFKLNIPWMFPQTKILSMQWYVKIIEHKKRQGLEKLHTQMVWATKVIMVTFFGN